jgi:hypothetical protein
MPIRNDAAEIQKMTAIANNEEQKPEVRILAARRLLRFTEFSVRSVRVAKRVAKLYYNSEDVSTTVRAKAASLLEFVLSKPADDGSPLESLTPAEVVKPGEPKIYTLEDRNRGWDAEPCPRKYISYYEPSDLPQFGIPADPDLAWKPEFTGKMLELATDAGGLYYVWFTEFSIAGKRENRIVNPRYIAAFKKWKSSPRQPFDSFVTEPWRNIFEQEDRLVKLIHEREPILMMFIPNQTFPKQAV